MLQAPDSAPPKPQHFDSSTPKTTAAQRFRARYVANSTPNFSPKKRLDFDNYESSSTDGSPRLRKNLYEDDLDERLDDAPMVPTSSSGLGPRTPPKTPNSSRMGSFSDHNSSGATIKPVSLISKFDCFSDSD